MKSTNNKILLLTALMMTSLSAFALKDDTNKPINIVSDNQSLDMENSVVTFTDNVVITQGSILIKANKVVITRPPENSGKKETVEAFGSPVTFHQQLDDGKPVDGRANKVHYDLGTEFLTLTGDAELKQLDSKINGERITYDVKKQQLKANGNGKSRAEFLAKSYKSRKVVSDVSLTVNSNEIVGLLGPNGAGKTTTFYMVVGLVRHDQGKITIDGDDISVLPMHERARRGIGYLPQEASIFRRLTVYENLMAVLEIRKDLTAEQRRERADELIDEFNISHIRDSLGQSLSGGERRRVEIARALAANPKFILLDEPFAGVDPISVTDIKKIITDLRNRGLGVLITDHNVRETLDVCERAYIVGEGKIIATGTPEEVMNDEHVKRVYLGEQFKL